MNKNENIYIPKITDFINYVDMGVNMPSTLNSKMLCLSQLEKMKYYIREEFKGPFIFSLGFIKIIVSGVRFDTINYYNKGDKVELYENELSYNIDWREVTAFNVVDFGELTPDWMKENRGEEYFVWSPSLNEPVKFINECNPSNYLHAYCKRAYPENDMPKFAFDVKYSTELPTV